jgi:hypothetical protein
MRILPLWLSAALVLSPRLARATTIYDSVNLNDPTDFNYGGVPLDPTLIGPDAGSFTVTSAQTLTLVSLELSAANPSDGGSLTVVLVTNSGNEPSYRWKKDNSLPTDGITTFTCDTVLATILDSTLSSTPSLITSSTSAALTPGVYWIGLETPQLPSSVLAGDTIYDGTYGSAEWWYTNDTDPPADSGVLGQLGFSVEGGPSSFPISGNNAFFGGPYEMILDTGQAAPEPGTLAILSGGLIPFNPATARFLPARVRLLQQRIEFRPKQHRVGRDIEPKHDPDRGPE